MDKLLTAKELSELTGINQNTIYRLARKGEIPYYKFGNAIRFNAKDFKKGETDGKTEILAKTIR